MPEFVTALEGVTKVLHRILSELADGYINFECLGTSALCDFLDKGRTVRTKLVSAWIGISYWW